MAIKKYFVSSPKPGYQFDRNAKKYYSYGYDIWISRQRVQERGFATKGAAEAAVIRLKEQEKNDRHGIINPNKVPYLIELFQKRLDTIEDHRERVRAKRIFKYFLDLLPKGLKVTELRTAHLQLFVETRQKDNTVRTKTSITNQTINRELVPIVASLKSAWKFFPVLDDYRPPRIPRPRIDKGRKERVISATEQDRIFEYLFADRREGEDRRMFENRRRTGQFLMLCLLTLSRPGEIAALKRTHIDLDAGVVEIHGTKTRFKSAQNVRRLSITETMARILKDRLALSNNEFVFTRSGAVTPQMYRELAAACTHADIKYGRDDRDAISFHTARHTGITMLLQAGMDLKTVGKMAGHSDSRMTLYYTHANPEMVNKASLILEQKMGRNMAKIRVSGE
jgi:integrase